MKPPTVMNASTLLSLYGLKWHPFTPGIPVEGLHCSPRIDSFVRRCEAYLREGGFAMLTARAGAGKSSALRLIDDRLSRMRDVVVRPMSHPQSGLADFYRELGDLFGVPLSPHNRWGGFKAIRDKWRVHAEATLVRPVLVIDEAQEMQPVVLNELRLLTSRDYDSRALLFVILVGDGRLVEKLQSDDMLPLQSRIRTHLKLDPATPSELAECLRYVLDAAGNAQLMTPALVTTLAEHAAGSFRTLMQMAYDLLAIATERELHQLDEKLFFELFALPPPPSAPKGRHPVATRATAPRA
jgi:type II secretory pathway predicted ATPase ExeA